MGATRKYRDRTMALERLYPRCNLSSCPLNNSCGRTATKIERSAYHTANDPVDVLFVSDCPTSKEMLNPLAFLGPERDLIREVTSQVCPETATLAYTYLARGWPCDIRSSKYLTANSDLTKITARDASWIKSVSLTTHPQKQQILSLCSEHLFQDIKLLRPKLLIIMGSLVKDFLFPNERKSLLSLQNCFREFQGSTVRFINNYDMVIKNPSSKKTWQRQLAACLTHKINEPETDLKGSVYAIKNLNEAIEYIDTLKNTPNDISFDVETLNLNKKYGNRLLTLQFSETNNSATVIPYNHKESPFLPEEIDILKKHLYDLFKNPHRIKSWIGHNLKFECNILSSIIGTPLASAPLFDTMVGAFLLDENRAERAAEFTYGINSLKQLALDYLNFDGYNKNILNLREEGSLFDLPLDELVQYGGMDTIVTRRLSCAELNDAKEQNFISQFFNLMYYHYTPLILMFSNIEQNGFFVNKQSLRNLNKKGSLIRNAIDEIAKTLKSLPEVQKANDILLSRNNPNTSLIGNKPWFFDWAKKGHPQVLFFDVCRLIPLKVGKSGAKSVDKNWQKQNENHPIVKTYVEWSAMQHLYDSFVTKLYARIDPQKDDVDSNKDCCIRPNFNPIGTVTGRASCDGPNLQQIPRADTPAKKAIKDIFCALRNHYLVQLDYKANEIRWVGILAQDENLAAAIHSGKKIMEEYRINPNDELLKKADIYCDIHKQTASMVFNKPIEEVTKDERQTSKTVIFALLYGSSAKVIAEKNNTSIEVVEDWFDQFYSRYPKIAIWKTRTEEMAKQYGYVETANGRRRRLPIFNLFRTNGYFSDQLVPQEYKGVIGEAIRQSVNSPIQGIASDYGMCGAALFSKFIREEEKPWKICNAVHDSCVFQVPMDQLEEALQKAEYYFTEGVMNYMAEVFDINFNLPLEVDFEIGLSWGSLIKWNFSKQELEVIKKKLIGV